MQLINYHSAYNPETIREDFEYIAFKLNVTVKELESLMQGKNRTYKDYKNKMYIFSLGTFIMRLFGEKELLDDFNNQLRTWKLECICKCL